MARVSARIAERNGVAALLRGRTAAGARVFVGLPRALHDSDLPCLDVTAEDQDGAPITDGGTPQYETTITLQVVASAADDDDPDAAADALIEQARTALLTDPAWMARFTVPPSWSVRLMQADEGARPIGRAELELRLTLPEHDWPVGLRPIAGAHIDIDILDAAGPDGVSEAALTLPRQTQGKPDESSHQPHPPGRR